MMVPSLMMMARSVISRVSRTLWSVMRMPIPRAARSFITPLMSATAIGSIPAKAHPAKGTLVLWQGNGQFLYGGALHRKEYRPSGSVCGQWKILRLNHPGAAFLFMGKVAPCFKNRPDIFFYSKFAENRRLLRQVRNAKTCTLVHRKPRNALVV